MTEGSATLGQILAAARHDAGRSLRGVATEVGMAPSYLTNLEHDAVRTPSPRHLKVLADALGLDYVALMRSAGYFMPDTDTPGIDRTKALYATEPVMDALAQTSGALRRLVLTLRG